MSSSPLTVQRAISPDKEQFWKDSALFCQRHLKKHLGSYRTGHLSWIGVCTVKDNWFSPVGLFPMQQWLIKAEKQRERSDPKGNIKYFTFLLAGKIKYDTSYHPGGCFWLCLLVLGFGLHLILKGLGQGVCEIRGKPDLEVTWNKYWGGRLFL